MTTPIKTKAPRKPAAPINAAGASFDHLADRALLAMKDRADEMKIKGVAVVAFSPGQNVRSWSSKMLAVGGKITGASKRDPKAGANCLAIAYAKAAEMADTKLDSGSGVRPPKLGENGWQGGAIASTRKGLIIAAFSGASSEDDLEVSKAGIAVLKAGI